MIYFKKVTKKLNKYIEDKSEKNIKNQKLKTSILKNNISRNAIKKLLKNLFTKQLNKFFIQ